MKANSYKKWLFTLVILLSALLLVSCSTPTPNNNGVGDNNAARLELTLDELAEYDGQDGRRTLIAFEGVIYDVSDHPAWAGGSHNGVMAGTDITDDLINVSPHEPDILDGVPDVGELVD